MWNLLVMEQPCGTVNMDNAHKTKRYSGKQYFLTAP